ncbi:MAG: type I DNA topoisomerase [Spirochaetaceae bacterium]|nr:MAG: type I DNA topoisomerase [Spirochaetaceae bacterium]
MAKKTLVIVESPTKAKTVKKFLPEGYDVEASIGHVRDLPQTAADVPKEIKQEPWSRLGIDVENDFAPLYIIPKEKKKIVRDLKKKVKEADRVLLATDEDREGESISWHLVQLLQPKVPVQRMVFHEITKTAITRALDEGREIDMNLVNAQETRRILDRLYGYTISPLIWKKIAYGLSAGRVQSPGLRLIVERERERMLFRKSEYWDLKAILSPKDKADQAFTARLEQLDGNRIAASKDFDSTTGQLLPEKGGLVMTQEQADDLRSKLGSEKWQVVELVEKQSNSRPSPPFITSTLQQEGNRKLGLSARETMRTAQRLYEQGFITYMRTDSPSLSSEAIGAARSSVARLYGEDYLSAEPRQFKAKSRGAQEAHEAIRPAGTEFTHPDKTGLTGKEKALYGLIWSRTMATQMAEARKASVTAKIDVGPARFTATGTRIVFPGFIRAYVEGKDDPDAALDDKETFLPELKEGQELDPVEVSSVYHETKPPARYTEASLVQSLEKAGIGRPSTYASIINTLYERKYIRKQGTSLVPTFTAFAVIQLLENHFNYLIEYGFTSDMENALDDIAEGEIGRLDYLKQFYLGENGLKNQVEQREGNISPAESRSISLPHLKEITDIKVGKYGPYIVLHEEDNEIHSSVPEDKAPADVTVEDIKELIELQKNGPVPIGQHPETGENIYCLMGRYGPYLQLGEKTEENPKPKRASLPSTMDAKNVPLDEAVLLLRLPRDLGNHPETGKIIRANNGRFGPYVVHDGDFRSLGKDYDLYTVTLSEALEIFAQPKKGRGGSIQIKDFGAHPKTGKNISVYNGKYGPFIKHGSKNIGLPEEFKEVEAAKEKLTTEKVIALVDAALKK